MLSRVSTTRRASLFLHSLQPRLPYTQSCYPLSALAASNEIAHTSGEAPYFCRHLNTGSHLVEAARNNGGHSPACKTEGHPLDPLQAFPKEEACDDTQLNACIQSYVKLSASTLRREKVHSSHGDVRVSDANGQSSDQEVKASESNAAPSKASRKKGPARIREAKVAKASRKSSFLSYGDVKVSESEARNQDVDGHLREGDVEILTREACRDEAQGTQGLEDLPSSVPSVLSRYDSDGGCAPQHTCSIDVLATSKSKGNCTPGHVSNASSGLLYPSLSLLTLLIQSRSKCKKMSQITMLELQRKVELLEAEKMPVTDAARLFKRRAFESASFERLSAVLLVLKEFFGTGERACKALTNRSKFLRHPVELLQQTLKVLTDFHIERETAMSFFSCHKAPFGLKVEELQKRLSFFRERGFTVEALNTMCRRRPMILSFSVGNRVLRKLEFLERAGFTQGRLLGLLQRHPGILSCSVDDNLNIKYEYFQQLGFSAQELCTAVEYLHKLSMKKIQGHVQAIKDLGFSEEDVRFMIRRQPTLIGMKTESLKARLDFLVHEQNRNMAEIVKCPACLMYSLHGRIIPRFKIIGTLGRPKVYSLATILCSSEQRFNSLVKGSEGRDW